MTLNFIFYIILVIGLTNQKNRFGNQIKKTMEKTSLSQKTANIFNRGFFAFYIFLFTLTLIGGMIAVAVFGELGTEYPMPAAIVVIRFAVLILSFAFILFAFICLSRFLSKPGISDKLSERKTNTKIIFICVGIMLAIQLVFMFCLEMNPVTDVSIIDSYAQRIVKNNSFDCIDSDFNTHYIVRYQNNLVYLIINTLIYKLTGTTSHLPLTVFGTLCINGAVLMTALTSRRVLGEKKALFTLALCALFTPYYTYTAYFYTDSYSIPFVIGTVYAFVAAVQSKTRGKKLLLLLLSGALCFVGFKIKGSVIVLIPALLLYLIIKYGIKRAAKAGAAILLSFCVLFASFTVALKSSGIISEESSRRYQFPATHWVMMGLKDMGAFNEEDSDYSKSLSSKSERREENLKEIGKRISDMGAVGLAGHLGRKAVWTYMDGTYYIANYLSHNKHRTLLHEFVLYDGKFRFAFFAYSFGYQMFLMFMIAYSSLRARRKGKAGLTLLFRIAVFGMVVFFIIWETNARYPFNFTPLYMLLATEGTFGLSERLKKKAFKSSKTPQKKP